MAITPGSNPVRSNPVLRRLRLPLLLTHAGLLAEQVGRAFWPVLSILLLVLAGLMLGLHEAVPIEVFWGAAALTVLALLVGVVHGVRRLHWPDRAEALARLDATLPGRPIAALLDEQAIGVGDAASVAVWRAHRHRMALHAAAARAVAPDMRLTRHDPFALRYVALLAFVVALAFGSIWRIGTLTTMGPGDVVVAGGPSWEGWIAPPRYTGRPTLYLNDMTGPDLVVPEGSHITIHLYGLVGGLSLVETISGRGADLAPVLDSVLDPAQDFVARQSGVLRIDGPGGREWAVAVIKDAAPEIFVTGLAEVTATGALTLPFTASDDHGVVSGRAVIALDRDSIDRRHGLTTAPEPRDPVDVELPMPISGDRRRFSEDLIEDFSRHPWANLPAIITLTARDAAGNAASAQPFATILPARRFFDPMAAAVIEARRDLLWSSQNAPRVAQVLRAISHRPEDIFRKETAYLRLRVTLRRLETFTRFGLTGSQQDEISEALWDLAVLLEEGDLGDALERLRRAQERLEQAMQTGASDSEIAELMQELRAASEEYMRQLSRLAQENSDGLDQDAQSGNTMQMTQNDLQRMMDHIQELMEQGRMAEAQQALQELQELMENMRIAQGQGENGQSEGQQAMQGLADTLREQQGLSDQAFRDLQEQFNPGAQAGENQGNAERNSGQGRGQGQGRGHEGQGGRGTGQDPGESGQSESLADRQQALRDELNRQQGQIPGAGTPDGDAARAALERAGRAMDGAEEALRRDNLAGAIDQQSEAMEALREGMRSLADSMAQGPGSQPGQGDADAEGQAQGRDPLGRQPGSQGGAGTDEGLLQGEDVYRRARELLDEIRRRSGEAERPAIELDYLQRLLDRF